MMKKILLLFLSAFSSIASVSAAEEVPTLDSPTHPTRSLSVGAGVSYAPTYPGAASQEFSPIPLVDARYGDLTFNTSQLATPFFGMAPRFLESQLLLFGGALFRDGRRNGDDDWLDGQRRIDPTAMAVIGGSWVPGHSLLLVRVWAERDMLSAGHGATMTGEILLRAPLPGGGGIQAGVTSTSANSQHLSTWYSSAAGSRASGGSESVSVSAGSGGQQEWGFLLEASVPLTTHLSMITRLRSTRLEERASRSPLVEDRRQESALLGILWDF